MKQPRLVLVSGVPRSGTTVIGELLTSAPRTGELYEPMNASVGDPAIRNPFEIPGSADFSHGAAETFIDRVAARRLRPRKASGTKRHPYFNRTNRTTVLDRLSPFRRTTVWKDPFAFFLIPQVVARGTIPVVVTLRDPLSLAGSFKRMNWTVEIVGLIARMREAGLPVSDSIQAAALTAEGPARTGSILTSLYHSVLLDWLDRDMNLLAVPTGDLIDRPADVAARLAAHTGLALDAPPAPEGGDAPDDANAALPDKAHVRKRSAASITDYWKQVLDADEIAYCRALNTDLWERLTAAVARRGWHSHG